MQTRSLDRIHLSVSLTKGMTVSKQAATTKAPLTPTQKAAQTAVKKADEKVTAQAQQAPATPKKYPFPYAKIHHARWEELNKQTGTDNYAPPLTMQEAKQLLGWQTENDYIASLKAVQADLNEDDAKKIFAKDKFLTDLEGNNVKLKNNTRNRPWGEGVTNSYMQDMLKKHWEFNGETCTIGEYGRVLSGQHRLIGLIFAEQSRTKESESAHWSEFWQDAVSIPTTIMYGIEESSKVTRTIDNVKSRTLGDVIYADTDLFGGLKSAGDRKSAARCLEYAVKLLWERTGVGDTKTDTWAPKRTHSEALDFVDRHPKLKECVKFIVEEDKDLKISRFLYPGHAAALLYMFSCTGTPQADIEDYFAVRPSNEKKLKFNNFKKGKMFFSDLARSDSSMQHLITAFKPITGDEEDAWSGKVYPVLIDGKRTGGLGTLQEQIGCLIRAWNAYVIDQPIVPSDVRLGYEVILSPLDSETKMFKQNEFPTIANSIDKGKKQPVVKEPKAEETANPSGVDEVSDEEGDELAEENSEIEDNNEGEESPTPTPVQKGSQEQKDSWDKDKLTYANHVLVYQSKNPLSDNYMVLFDDAMLWSTLTGRKAMEVPDTGVLRIVVDQKHLDIDAKKIMEEGHNILVFNRPDEKGKTKISAYSSPEENTEPLSKVKVEEPKAEQPKQKVVIRKKD